MGFEVPWPNFRRALVCLGLKRNISQLRTPEHLSRMYEFAKSWTNSDMITIYTGLRSLRCSDVRDMVYGILGIAPSWFVSGVRPEYSLPVGEVYKKALLVYLDHTQRLDLFRFTFQSQDRVSSPSWVTDWHVAQRVYWLGMQGHFASGISRAHTRLIKEGTLEVIGIECATVETVSEPAPNDVGELISFVRKWRPKGQKSTSYLTGENMEDAYIRTIMFHATRERYPDVPQYPPLEDWKREILSPVDIKTTTKFRPLLKLKDITFVSFKNGYIGIGPTRAQAGKRPGSPRRGTLYANEQQQAIDCASSSAAMFECYSDRSLATNIQ